MITQVSLFSLMALQPQANTLELGRDVSRWLFSSQQTLTPVCPRPKQQVAPIAALGV